MNSFFSPARQAAPPHATRPSDADETKWVRAAQRGDIHAFNQLILRYQERAYRVAYHLLQDTVAATHVLQNVVAHAFETLREMGKESFEVWLLRLLTQSCAAFLQAHPAPPPRTPLQRGMANLPLVERITLVLADLENFAPPEIAQILRTDTATVRAQTSRARRALRDALYAGSAQNG
jgi:RNA polymerase sigma-70 factor (ECF subfamily)